MCALFSVSKDAAVWINLLSSRLNVVRSGEETVESGWNWRDQYVPTMIHLSFRKVKRKRQTFQSGQMLLKPRHPKPAMLKRQKMSKILWHLVLNGFVWKFNRNLHFWYVINMAVQKLRHLSWSMCPSRNVAAFGFGSLCTESCQETKI